MSFFFSNKKPQTEFGFILVGREIGIRASGRGLEARPAILWYKEGAFYRVRWSGRGGVHRKLKPETYLLQREADGNLYLNTGFRIDVAYNEETDILSFSPNGDYIRVNTDETANGEKKKEQ